MDEKQLIKQVLEGDSSSFSYFVDTYQDMAMTIAFRLLRNRQDAEDVVQNAFVKAYYNLHTYRSTSKFSTWFYQIVYNTAITAYNKIKGLQEVHDVENKVIEPLLSRSNPADSMEEQEQKEKVERAIEQLPKSEAIIVSLYYIEEYSVKEIAEIMSLNKSNVKIKLFRARKLLEDLLKG